MFRIRSKAGKQSDLLKRSGEGEGARWQVMVALILLGTGLLGARARAVDSIAFMRPNVTGGSTTIGNIALIGSDGSNERVAVSSNTASNPALSKDGSKLAYDNNNQIWVADANGNNPHAIALSSEFRGALNPAWSPDGLRIAFEGSTLTDTKFHLYIVTLSSGAVQQVTGVKANPDTSVIRPPSGTIGTTEYTDAFSNDTDPAWSPDGKQLAFTSDRQYLTNGGTGLKIVNSEIFRINLSTLAQTRVTVLPNSNDEKNPTWSPDGQKIAFEMRISTLRAIGQVGSTQSNVTASNITELTTNPSAASEPCYSPDGKNIAFVRDVDTIYNILIMRAVPESDSNVPHQLTHGGGRQPSWGVAAPIVKPTPGPHSINGRVLFNPTTGLSPVNVYLVANNDFAALYGSGPSTDIRRTTTLSSPISATGNYSFTNVPPGNYKVVALDSGTYFKPVMASVTISTADIQNVDFLRAGTDSIGPTVTVDAPQAGSYANVAAANGKVSDTGGSGVQAVVVSLYRLGSTNQIYNWTTNTYVAANSNDPGVFKVATLSSDLKSWSLSLPATSIPPNSTYRLSVIGIDNAYKTSATVNREFSIKITPPNDTTPPKGSITTPVNGTTSSFGPISGTATDDVALDHVKIAIVRPQSVSGGTQYQYWNGTTWVNLTTVPGNTTLPPAQIALLLLPRLAYADTALPRVTLSGKSASWKYTTVPTGTGTYYVAAAVYDKAQNSTLLPGSPGYFLTVTVASGTGGGGNGTAPPNDNFANAQVITGTQSFVIGTNVGATKEPGEPTHSGVTDAGDHTVWYRWTTTINGQATLFTVGSDFRNVIQVFTGDHLASLTEVPMQVQDTGDADNDNNYQVAFNALAGQTYDISVTGRGTATGKITLNYQLESNEPDLIGHAALSAASAKAATSSVQLGFSSALNAETASDPAHFVVTVNGQTVTVESAGYNANTHTVLLSLPPGALRAGAKVAVTWQGLTSSSGALASGHTPALLAR